MNNVMAYKSRLTYKEIEQAIQEFSNIPYSIVKGEALSILAYGMSGKRVSSDVDILVSRKNLQLLEKIFLKNHFIKNDSFASILEQRNRRVLMMSASHQTTPLYMQKGIFKLSIDLNFDIFWGEYTGKRIDLDDFMSDTIDIEIYGCMIKTLPPLKALIQLILHHYKDLNSIFLLATRKRIKQDMFKDLYYLLKNNLNDIKLDKLYEKSSEYEIIPYVYYVLYYTGFLFKEEIMDKYIAAFKTPEGEMLLNCYGLNESERHEWKCDFQTRLKCENLYNLIENDLTQKDLEKISINKKMFLDK